LNTDNTYVRIDLDAVAANLDAIRSKAGVQVMGIVKADAYGHGAVPIARFLQDKCAFFGVSNVAEALELRQSGIRTPILILGHTPPSAFSRMILEGIRPAIFSLEDALELSKKAVSLGKTAPFHFAVDTGMSRLGFQATYENAEVCAKIANLPNLEAEGLFSHFASADCADLSKAQAQEKRFEQFDRWLKELGVNIPIRHMNNSAGIMNFENQYELVRSGIVTYGLYPSDAVDPGLLELKPALQWFSRVSHVKELPAGREISYGGTYVTTGPTRVATVPVGYADGYRRSLSGKFHVLIHGTPAPILGRICMDQMMVDVTGIENVRVGDTVTLVGTDGEGCISVEQIAAEAGSFNYEFICGISRRVPRYYYRNGELVRKVHYLLDNL